MLRAPAVCQGAASGPPPPQTGQAASFRLGLARVALIGPPPLLGSSPFSVLVSDLRDERRATVPFPPGETRFSLARTRRFAAEPLPMLLEAYERFGPVFTLRLFHGNVVFMLGPAANHYVTV